MTTNWPLAISINVGGNFVSAVGWMLQKKQHTISMSELPHHPTRHIEQKENQDINERLQISAIEFESASSANKNIEDTNLQYMGKICISWRWWMGFICYGGGSAISAISYTYGPNSLLLPLETCILAFTTLLGWKCLNEKIFIKDFIGIACIFIGVIGSVFVAPKEEEQDEYTISELTNLYKQSKFWIFISSYTTIVIIGYLCYAMPKCKQYIQAKNDKYFLVIFVNLSAYFGAWNLVMLKSTLEIMASSFGGKAAHNFSNFMTYFIFLGFIITILTMEYWRQKALAIFVSTYVLAVYRVFANTSGVLFGAYYWNDFVSVKLWEIMVYIVATIITFIGVAFIAMTQTIMCKMRNRRATETEDDFL